MSSYYVIQLGWVPKFEYVRSHYRDFFEIQIIYINQTFKNSQKYIFTILSFS